MIESQIGGQGMAEGVLTGSDDLHIYMYWPRLEEQLRCRLD
jgi:hypothetical protein